MSIGTHSLRKGHWPRLKMMTKSFRNKEFMQSMRRLNMHSREGPAFLFWVWRQWGWEESGREFWLWGGALLSLGVCMSPSWLAMKILSNWKLTCIQMHCSSSLYVVFFLILSHMLWLRLNCHIFKLKLSLTLNPLYFYFGEWGSKRGFWWWANKVSPSKHEFGYTCPRG